mgnify:CR=1 FL=1
MLGAVLQSQAGDGEPSGGHRGIESVGADDLAAVSLDAQRDTSTSTVGLGADAVLRELQVTLSPERLGAIRPLLVAVQCLIGVHCTAPKRQRLRWPRWVGKVRRNFNSWVSTSEDFVYNLSELGVQQAEQ